MPKATIDDVWIFVYDHEDVRTRDLEQEFVKTKQLARGTLYKYKRLLEVEGKIQARPIQGRPPYNIYYVPEHYYAEIEAIKQYKNLPPEYLANYVRARDEKIPAAYYPEVSVVGSVHNLEWKDAAPIKFHSDVKRKVLWENPETGAVFELLKVPPGIMEPVHYHKNANKWALGLSGESELPDGTRMSIEGIYAFVPKGTPHVHPRVTKETIILCFFDGPREKTVVQP